MNKTNDFSGRCPLHINLSFFGDAIFRRFFMNYRCSHKSTTFPYNCSKITAQQKYSTQCGNSSCDNFEKSENCKNTSNLFTNLLNNLLSPIEKAIGREINFDDLLLIALIYLLYTEKDNDNNLLLLCLIFLLF